MVLAHKSMNNTWWQQADGNIRATLEFLVCLGADEVADLRTADMVYYTSPTAAATGEEPRPFDEAMRQHFFDCDWSDFACDHMLISGTLRLHWPDTAASPPASEPTRPTRAPRADRWN